MNVNLTNSGIHAEIQGAREITQKAVPDAELKRVILIESPDFLGLGVYEVWFSTNHDTMVHVTVEGQLVAVDLPYEEEHL
jgi:hypothetical protein